MVTEVDSKLAGIYPRFEDFYMEYYPYLRKLVVSFGFRSREDTEDYVQELFEEFYQGKEGRSYFQIYNKDLSQFKTFLTNFTVLRLLNRISKRKRQIKAASLDDDDLGFSRTLSIEQDMDTDVAFREFYQRQLEEIRELLPNRRGFVPSLFRCKKCALEVENYLDYEVCPTCGGRVWQSSMTGAESVERSHAVVFEMLIQELPRKEISRRLKYSDATISLLIREIAELPGMVRLWNQFHNIED